MYIVIEFRDAYFYFKKTSPNETLYVDKLIVTCSNASKQMFHFEHIGLLPIPPVWCTGHNLTLELFSRYVEPDINMSRLSVLFYTNENNKCLFHCSESIVCPDLYATIPSIYYCNHIQQVSYDFSHIKENHKIMNTFTVCTVMVF